MAKEPKTDFQSLISYIKFLLTITVTCIGLIVGAFTFFLWNDKRAISDDIQKVKEDSKEKIVAISELAEEEISKIKNEVNYRTQLEVNNLIASGQIQSLIEEKVISEINKKAATIIDTKVRNATKEIDSKIKIRSDLDRLVDRMRGLDYLAMEELKKYANSSTNEYGKLIAKESLEIICAEITAQFKDINTDNIKRENILKIYENAQKLLDLDSMPIIPSLNYLGIMIGTINSTYSTNFTICELPTVVDFLEEKL